MGITAFIFEQAGGPFFRSVIQIFWSSWSWTHDEFWDLRPLFNKAHYFALFVHCLNKLVMTGFELFFLYPTSWSWKCSFFCTKLWSKKICRPIMIVWSLVLYSSKMILFFPFCTATLFCIKLVEEVDSAVYFLFCLLVGGSRTGGCVSISPHFNADTLHSRNILNPCF